MSTKPVSLPRWADVGGVIVVPGAGKLNVGWVADERPPAQYLNWYQNLVYLWVQYVSDGNFQGASTFNSTLGITGATTIGSTLGVTGAATLSSTLGVTGVATLLSTLIVTGLITASAGLTAGANQHITISGTGRYKHGSITYPVSILGPYWFGAATQAIAAVFGSSSHHWDWVTSATSIDTIIPINGLPLGARILTARVVLKDVSGQPVLKSQFFGADKAGATTAGATTSSAASGSTQTITIASINHTIGTTTTGDIYLRFTTATNATGTYALYSIEVDVDFP